MVDEDWWMGTSARGETGLFPSNYVELVEGGDESAGSVPPPPQPQAEPEPASFGNSGGKTATAQCKSHFQHNDHTITDCCLADDYEATEDNELSFPEGATIHNIVRLKCWRGSKSNMLTCNRNSQTTIGGKAPTMAKRVSSLPTMSNWTASDCDFVVCSSACSNQHSQGSASKGNLKKSEVCPVAIGLVDTVH